MSPLSALPTSPQMGSRMHTLAKMGKLAPSSSRGSQPVCPREQGPARSDRGCAWTLHPGLDFRLSAFEGAGLAARATSTRSFGAGVLALYDLRRRARVLGGRLATTEARRRNCPALSRAKCNSRVRVCAVARNTCLAPRIKLSTPSPNSARHSPSAIPSQTSRSSAHSSHDQSFRSNWALERRPHGL